MKTIRYNISIVLMMSVLGTSQLYAFDGIRQRVQRMYGEFILGKGLYKALEDNQCNLLMDPSARTVVFEEKYQAPWWIAIAKRVWPQESLTDYAKDIYSEIERNFKVINDMITAEKLFKDKVSMSDYLEFYTRNLNPIILGSGFPTNIEQVRANIKQAITYLQKYKKQLANTNMRSPDIQKSTMGKPDVPVAQMITSAKKGFEQQEAQQIRELQLKIDAAIFKITALQNKPFMSSLERSNRKSQLERLNNWVSDRCKMVTTNLVPNFADYD